MKNFWKICAVAMLFALALTGCDKSDDDNFDYSDGSAGFIASELATVNSAMLGAMTATFATVSMPTDTGEVIVTPWHLEPSIQGFVREANAVYGTSTRNRVDTLYFYDADSTKLTSALTIGNVKYVSHLRKTTVTSGENIVQITMNISSQIDKSTDTTITRNGTVSGTYNDTPLATSSTISNVIWRYSSGTWLTWPISGTVTVDRPLRLVEIVFTGSNTAQVTVTRKATGESRTITVRLDTGAEG